MAIDRIKRGLSSPKLFAREANRQFHTRLGNRPHNINGVDIFEQDWDNLIILDACRHDIFAEQAAPHLTGQLESRISRGSNTYEWLKANVSERELYDTVYVTATPQYYQKFPSHDEFFDVIEVWDTDAWDSEIYTLPPDAMTDAVIEAANAYPNKRILGHYLQPHFPYIGPTADSHRDVFDLESKDIFSKISTGKIDISDDVLRTAYRETLEAAVPEVSRAVDKLDGKTVLSADHGEMIGQRSSPIPIREYGHPRKTYTEELVKVPWFVCDHETRRDIRNGEAPMNLEHDAVADVEQRLADLGYVN